MTPTTLIKTLTARGYPVFKGDYNVNLVGVRSGDRDANTFNDTLYVLFQQRGRWILFDFAMTTDPGVHYRENPINVDGTAVLVPGHHSACWQIGSHRGQYKALVQRGEMAVYRDGDGDNEIDTAQDSIQRGHFGINLHRASRILRSVKVDRWSAGCQVLADPDDFDLLMAIVKRSAAIYGDKFSYTLLDEGDLL